MRYLVLCFFLLLESTSSLYAFEIAIDENSSNLSILDKSSIFIDKTNALSLQEIKKQKFLKYDKERLNLGYKADRTLWIRFTLHNKSSRKIKKNLEFANDETEKVFLYSDKNILKGGFYFYDENHQSLTPSFLIKLNSYEKKVYYLKTSAKIKTLKAKITLWNEIDFLHYSMNTKMYNFIFLGMIIILIIYNAVILFFTQDKAYFYYLFYLLSMLLCTNYYSGFISYYFLSKTLAIWLIKLHTIVSTVFVASCILFAQNFLQTKQFKKLHKALNISLYSLPFIAILSYDNWLMNSHLVTSLLLIGMLIVYTGFYALFKGVEEAQYYVWGWSIVLLSLMLFSFQSLGTYNLQDYHLGNLIEMAFVVEGLLFSLALAHRIRVSNQEKSIADAKVIYFQEKEKERLDVLVQKKTKELKIALNQKDILYKELNHRVKNNFMMILSLLKLQILRSKLPQTKASLKVTENRIRSIAHLYEILLLHENTMNIDTLHYLQKIYLHIGRSFQKEIEIEIEIKYDIQYDVKLNVLVYVGLIFNELISNTHKYAFISTKGKIFVTLRKIDNIIHFIIEDNGQGFEEKSENSLGLIIVEKLIQNHLDGKVSINAKNGTKITMSWREE